MQLPNEVDPPGTNLATVEALYQLLQIWQLGHNSKACSNHENTPIISNRGTQAMGSTENRVMKVGFVSLILDFAMFPGVVKEPSRKSVPRFYQEVKAGSSAFSPRGNHERVTLPERPKSDGRNPYVDVLSSFNLPRPCDRHVYPNPAMISRNYGLRMASAKSDISIQNGTPLQGKCSQENTAKNEDVEPWKSQPWSGVLPQGINRGSG